MTDMIVKGTGNSRFLRSAIPADITFSQFVALLREGALPIDLAGLNDEGIEVKGTALSKGTLLSDATETAIWGDAADRTVDEALRYSFSALMGYAGTKATVVTGTYTGDNAADLLGFTPKAVLLGVEQLEAIVWQNSGSLYYNQICATIDCSVTKHISGIGYVDMLKIVDGGFAVTNGGDSNSRIYYYTNYTNRVYKYIAIGLGGKLC